MSSSVPEGLFLGPDLVNTLINDLEKRKSRISRFEMCCKNRGKARSYKTFMFHKHSLVSVSGGRACRFELRLNWYCCEETRVNRLPSGLIPYKFLPTNPKGTTILILKSSGKVFVLLKIIGPRYQMPHHISSQLFMEGISSVHLCKTQNTGVQ